MEHCMLCNDPIVHISVGEYLLCDAAKRMLSTGGKIQAYQLILPDSTIGTVLHIELPINRTFVTT